jgi:hypothetical protein
MALVNAIKRSLVYYWPAASSGRSPEYSFKSARVLAFIALTPIYGGIMYLRLQIMDTQEGHAIAALVVPAHMVSPATAQQWAEHIAQDADARAGVPGLHSVRSAEAQRDLELALKGLKGVGAGGGGNRGIKPKGVCMQCGGTYPLTKDGHIAKHGKPYGKLYSKIRCSGSGKPPSNKRAGATGK